MGRHSWLSRPDGLRSATSRFRGAGLIAYVHVQLRGLDEDPNTFQCMERLTARPWKV